MVPDQRKLTELRRRLNLLVEEAERLNDPEVLKLARQLDRLMAEEMKKEPTATSLCDHLPGEA